MADTKRKSFADAFSSLLKEANAPGSKKAKKQISSKKASQPSQKAPSTSTSSPTTEKDRTSGKKRRRAPPPENAFTKFRKKSQRPPKKQKNKRQNKTNEKVKGKQTPRKSAGNKSSQKSPPATEVSAKQRKKLAKRARDSAHVQPDVAVDAQFERSLKKIATRGVIKLFNAVQKQQDALARAEREADFKPARKQRADTEAAASSFMAMLRSNPKSAKSDNNASATSSSVDTTKKEPARRSLSHRSSTGLGQDEFGLSGIGRSMIKDETRSRSPSPESYGMPRGDDREPKSEDDGDDGPVTKSASKWDVLGDHFLTGSGDEGDGDAASDGDFEDDMSD